MTDDDIMTIAIQQVPGARGMREDLLDFARALLAAAAPVAAQEPLDLLRAILDGDTGRQVLHKLSDGQGTETAEGKAWLAALTVIASQDVRIADMEARIREAEGEEAELPMTQAEIMGWMFRCSELPVVQQNVECLERFAKEILRRAAPVAAQEPGPALVIALEALDKLARLGNEPRLGNSHGNEIAQRALRPIETAPPAQGARQPDEPLELAKIAELIVQRYAGKPDDFTTSIGDWEMRDDFGLPSFGSYLCIPLGDWRKYANRA